MSAPEHTTALILDPNTGDPVNVPTILFDPEDARTFRLYKKLLQKYGLREALYCNDCWAAKNRHDGTEAHVTDNEIIVRCRCKLRFYQGPTY